MYVLLLIKLQPKNSIQKLFFKKKRKFIEQNQLSMENNPTHNLLLWKGFFIDFRFSSRQNKPQTSFLSSPLLLSLKNQLYYISSVGEFLALFDLLPLYSFWQKVYLLMHLNFFSFPEIVNYHSKLWIVFEFSRQKQFLTSILQKKKIVKSKLFFLEFLIFGHK